MRRTIAIWLCAMMVVSTVMVSTDPGNDAEAKEAAGNEIDFIIHAPIRINSNAGFIPANGVSGGNGSTANPWIIEGFEINGAGYGYCIYIGNTTQSFIMRNNYLHHASGISTYPYYYDSGLILYNVQNGIVINNSAPNNRLGINLWSSSHNTIANNNAFTNSQSGIFLYSSGSNTVVSNNASNNLGFGMSIGTGSNANTIAHNIANSNINVGIYVCWNSVSNTVNNNTASLNSNGGIFVSDYANSNTFVNNILFSNSGLGGFYFQRSSSNKIYHNNIIGNSVQAYSDSSNTWHNGSPSGGNYWSNYAGVDGNGDGIGDTPYSFSGGQDNYPLMHRYASVINQNTGKNFLAIQAAIDDAETLNGHTIKVNAGTYYETVNVTKSLTLIGENMATTIVNHTWVGFTIFADNVSISNFTIIGITGFQLDHSNSSSISSMDVKCYGFEGNNSNAVDLYYSNNNTISNITASGLKSGIVLLNSDYNTICDNNLFDNHLLILPNFHIGNGIYLQESRHNTFFRNTITENDYGIMMQMNSTDNVIYHNDFMNNLYQSYGSSSNHWDNGYPGGGNFWSDYSGVDHFSGASQNIPGSDGFGDTPYTNIYGGTGAQDSYPLMKSKAFAFSHEMISFQSGWNLISFPMDDPSINGTVIRRASDMSNQTSPVMLSKWDSFTQSYINYIPGFHMSTDPENFVIGADDAVFIFTSAGSSHSVFGYISTVQRSVTLQPGWNLIGYHSLSLGDVEIDWAGQLSCGPLDDICYWDGITFRHYIFPSTVMELTPGRGYFVWSDSVTTLIY